MLDNQTTTESPNHYPNAPKKNGGWGCTIPILIGFSLLVGFLGFVLWEGIHRAHRQLEDIRGANLGALSEMHRAVQSFFEVTGAFPPMTPLESFAEYDWQKKRLMGAQLFTVNPGEKDESGVFVLGKVSLSRIPTDVYSDLPVAYFTDGKGCIVFIPGPDGDFDIKDPAKLFSSETGMNNPELKKLINEGYREKEGDVVKIFIPRPPTPEGAQP